MGKLLRVAKYIDSHFRPIAEIGERQLWGVWFKTKSYGWHHKENSLFYLLNEVSILKKNYIKLLGALLLILVFQAASSAASDTAEIEICNKYLASKHKLSQIYDEYSSLPKKPENAEKLFLLYQRLEQATTDAQALYPSDYNRNVEQYDLISECLWDDKFSKIGLSIGHYSDRLEYSKQLMAETHQLNPNSKYRSYTLFTAIYGNANVYYDGFPDIEIALLYLKEFPNGFYVTDVNARLAGFYHDLYAALRERELVPKLEDRGVTYDCYDEYIDSHPEEANLERARKLGIFYFEKVIANIPLKDHRRKMYLNELDSLKKKKTDNVINVCGD